MSILHNAAEVLRLFGTGCADLTVSEVTTRLNMPKANASRLLKSMRDAGLLETIGDTRRHRPGRLVLDLAAAFKHSSGVIGRASGKEGLEDLLAKLAEIRAQGFAYSSQEATPGVDAIAIAVADPVTEEAVSLCIVYPHAVVDRETRDEMLAALAAGATRIADELGDTGFVALKIPQKG